MHYIFWLKHIAIALLSFIETAMKIKIYILLHFLLNTALAVLIETAQYEN
jgi:hypothetical protein